MTEERVRIEVSDRVADVALVRPAKHNALDVAMFEALADACERLAGEAGVRAVVLHGEGPSFCSGLEWSASCLRARDSRDSFSACTRIRRIGFSAWPTAG